MHQGSGCARSGGWPQGEPSSSPSWPSCCFAFGEPAPPRETIFRAVRPCDPAGRLRILRTSNANRARDDQWQIVVQLMASRGIMPPRATSSLGTNESMDQTDAHAGGRPASVGMPRSASGGYQARRSTSGDRERAADAEQRRHLAGVRRDHHPAVLAAERVCDLGQVGQGAGIEHECRSRFLADCGRASAVGSANAKRERHGGALKVFSPVHKGNAGGLRAGIDVKRGASGLVSAWP